MHLVDANIVITAARTFFQLDRVPEFWEWLEHQGAVNNLKMPVEIIEEVTGRSDPVSDWLRDERIHDALCLDEEVDVDRIQEVVSRGYAPDLDDAEMIKVGRDPFLIAYAFGTDRVVVTGEVSRPATKRANRKVPDVCRSLGVNCCDVFGLIGALNFSTNWRARLELFV